MTVKFLHTGDWHLGMQAHFLPEEARARYAEDRFDAVRRIAEIARSEDCAFVVAAGDVFHSNLVDERTLAKAIDALSSFSVPVFLLPGNHDPLDPTSVYRRAAWRQSQPAPVVVIEDATPLPVIGADGVEIVGFPCRSRHLLADPLAPLREISRSEDGPIRVVIGHGVVDELSPDADNPALIASAGIIEALQGGKADYVGLGDRHSVTELAGGDGRAYYAGTPVCTDYGETDPNEVLVVTLGEGGCAVERRAVGAWRFESASRELSDERDVEALGAWLQAFESKHTTVIRLALRGTVSLTVSALLEEMLEQHRMTFASLNTWERQTDLVLAPDDVDLAALDVSGYVREALDQLREEAAGSDEDAMVARDALNLLYRVAK